LQFPGAGDFSAAETTTPFLRAAGREPELPDESDRLRSTGTRLAAACTTANWFELQRAQEMLGRTFLPDEDQHGRNRVVVLDYGYWERRFRAIRRIFVTLYSWTRNHGP
jgi:hypothetical protein